MTRRAKTFGDLRGCLKDEPLECVVYAIWPGDPEAEGPYMSGSGRFDVFDTPERAERFNRNYIGDPKATIRRMWLRPAE